MLIPQSFDNVIGSLGFDYLLIFLIDCWLVVTWLHNRFFEAPQSCRWLRMLRHAAGGAESFRHWKSLWFGSDINQWHHKHLASRDVFNRFILIILILSALLWIFFVWNSFGTFWMHTVSKIFSNNQSWALPFQAVLDGRWGASLDDWWRASCRPMQPSTLATVEDHCWMHVEDLLVPWLTKHDAMGQGG